MEEKLDAILDSYVVTSNDAEVRDRLLAASFVVVSEKKVIYSKAVGHLDFPPSSEPYTTSSISWLASMTKLLTATCLLQLVEQGVVGLDEDLRPKVPQLADMQILRGFDSTDKPVLEDNISPITLRHLLSHTVGLGYDIADPDLNKWSSSIGRTANNLQWSLAGFTTPLKFTPGEGWYYGSAYDWAGHLLTILTGKKLSEYMREHIFTPLGMEATTFWPKEVDGAGKRMLAFAVQATGEGEDGLLKPGKSFVPEEHEMESGGAGLFSTPDDYAAFLRAILSNRLLKPETADLLFAPQLNDTQQRMLMAIASLAHDAFTPEFPKGAELNHGLGGVLNVEDIAGKRRGGSLMWSGMSNGRWWIDRETGIAAAMLTCVLPHGHAVVTSLWDRLERAVYESEIIHE